MNNYEKKYKEALTWMQSLYDGLHGATKEDAEHYFPELKESEDERIRKWLIGTIKQVPDDSIEWETISKSDILAWLEKQGEQKQDPCVNCKDVRLNCHNFPCIKKRAFKQGKSVFDIINEEKVDNANKIEPKFRDGDTMRTLQEASNGITSGLPVIVSIDNEYYHCNNELIAIKNQDNYEYPPMNRRQNPTWSEEDKVILDEIIDFFENGTVKLQHDLSLYASWLKSLKDRYTWKPSGEQINAIRLARSFVTDDFGANPTLSDTLVELEKQLKKLK